MSTPTLDHSKAVTDVGRELDRAAGDARRLADDLEAAFDHCQVSIGLCRRLQDRLA